jgi:hypothetical protein
LIPQERGSMMVGSTACGGLRVTIVRNVFELLGRCLEAGKPFRFGALPTLNPFMDSRASEGLVNLVSLVGAYSYASSRKPPQ